MPLRTALQYLTSAGFVGLAVVATLDWVRFRGQARLYQALGIGLLALVSVIGRVQAVTGRTPVGTAITVTAFMFSGYALLLFRGTFVPYNRLWRWSALAICIAVSAFGAYASHGGPLNTLAGGVIVTAWLYCVVEPTIRFWIAARGRAAVQRARLRALSLGYAGIIVILVVAGYGGSRVSSEFWQVATQVVAALSIPLLWAAFSPPRWLRRWWRSREEEAFRAGYEDLVVFAPDHDNMAMRAVEWASRLLGGEGAALADGNEILAVTGLSDTDRSDVLLAMANAGARGEIVRIDDRRSAIVVPVKTKGINAVLGVLSGNYTPVFGTDELERLRAYSASVALGLERTMITERLTSVERAKTDFLNLASHELRGPLTVLRGYLSMVQDGDLGEVPAPMRTVIPALVRQSEQMSLIVDQMIETARLEDGRLELRISRCDLGDLVSACVDEERSLLRETHTIELDGEAGVHLPMDVDAERIRTIVINLLDNAIKYSPNGGAVTCRLSAIGGNAELAVSDSGIGIAETDLERLFTRFGRIVTSENAHIPGTGLGLYLCRELARRHGGDLTVASAAGEGTTFRLSLPLAADTPARTEPAPAADPTPSEAHVSQR